MVHQVNHRLHSIVKNSVLAQYLLELEATGNIDVSSNIAPAEKLSLLREHEKRRRALDLRVIKILGPPPPGESHQNCLIGTYGLFVDVSTFPMNNQTRIRVLRFPTLLDQSPPASRTTLVDFLTKTYTFNEQADLLVLLRDVDKYTLSICLSTTHSYGLQRS